MEAFRLKFIGGPRGTLKAYVQTPDIQALEKSCLHQGLGIIAVQSFPSWMYGFTAQRGRRIQNVILFTQALHQLLQGGVPLLEAIQTMITLDLAPDMKVIACDIGDHLLQGQSFSQCLGRHRRFFDVICTGLLENGERQGNYVPALERCLVYLKMRERLRQDLSKALTYPLLLMALSLGLLSFLCAFVLPELVRFIQSFSQDLPLSTRLLIALSQNYETFLGGFLGLLLGLFLLVTQGTLLTQKIALWRDRLILKAPFYGPIFNLQNLTIFFTTLATLSQGGQKLSGAFQIASQQVPNVFLQGQLLEAYTHLNRGASLETALKSVPGIPGNALKLLQVGLQSSRLTENLDLIVQDLNGQLTTRIERLIKYVQPATLLGVGGVFLWIVLSIFLPIYQTVGVIE